VQTGIESHCRYFNISGTLQCLTRPVSLHPLPPWLRLRSIGHRHMPRRSRLRPAPRAVGKFHVNIRSTILSGAKSAMVKPCCSIGFTSSSIKTGRRQRARRRPSAWTRADRTGQHDIDRIGGGIELAAAPIMRPTAIAEWDDAELTRAERNRIHQRPAGPK
jgi:hypothetical protein